MYLYINKEIKHQEEFKFGKTLIFEQKFQKPKTCVI